MGRTQFTFYESYEKGAELFDSAEDKVQWYRAIVRGSLYGEEPAFYGDNARALGAAWSQAAPVVKARYKKGEAMRSNKRAYKGAKNLDKLPEVPEPEPMPEPEEPPALFVPPKVSPFAEFGL